MNLISAISYSILAGGPGSGCHGPNCGRPQGPGGITEGSTVTLKVPVKGYKQSTGNTRKFQPGHKAMVLNVLPKIGTGDQMLTVQLKKDYYTEHVKMSDVELHKSGEFSSPKIAIGKIQKSKIIQQFTSSDGARVTWVRPQEEAEREPKTLKQIAESPSSFKGKFQLVETVPGADGQTTRFYDTHPGSKGYQQEGSGQVVWVHRYPGKVVIQEQSTRQYSTKSRGILTFEYKNIGSAFGMLNRRYGIRIPVRGGF